MLLWSLVKNGKIILPDFHVGGVETTEPEFVDHRQENSLVNSSDVKYQPYQALVTSVSVWTEASFNTLCWSLSFIVVLQCIAGMVRGLSNGRKMLADSSNLFRALEI